MNFSFEFLGTGTSQGVPVVGCDCATCTSIDSKDQRLRTSAWVKVNDVSIVIDVGPDFRQQMLRSKVKKVDAVLLTHEHTDHMIGLDDLRPFMFRQSMAMPVYAEKRVLAEVKKRFAYAFESHIYPGAPKFELHEIKPSEVFKVNGLAFKPIRVLHGDLPILGFRLGNLAYLTDVKSIPESSFQDLVDLDFLIISSLRKKSHHSHASLSQAIELSNIVGARETYFTHFSHLIGRHQKLEAELPATIFPAFDGLLLKN